MSFVVVWLGSTCNLEEQRTMLCEAETQNGSYLDETKSSRAGSLTSGADEKMWLERY